MVREPTRVPLLVILILATLTLAGLLANEAHQAARFHQVTAERALADYAGFAAWEMVAAAEENVHLAVAEALSPATGRRASSPYEHVPPPEILLPAAAATLRCRGDEASRYYFRLDFRDGAVTTSGAQSSPVLLRHLADTVTADYRRSYRPDWRYAVIFDSALGRDRAIVYGVLFAEYQAPIAAYGFVTCASAFGEPLFTRALEHVALFPNSSGRGTGGDSLVALTVTLPDGRELFRSGTTNALPFAGTASMERLGGLMVRAALEPEAAARLALGRSVPGRLPVLIGLLAVTAALAGVALVQLRREHELARLRADFTSSVSHELRTPLAQILLFGETLSFGRVRSDADRRVAAETIVQETRRLIHMVENLLHFARSERGLD
ncbi:MAG: histidine kinase dimerization/phospho-acceptor domain-containing protein, partial [Gemmatimonadota bacterium]